MRPILFMFLLAFMLASDVFAGRPGWVCDDSGCRPIAASAAPVVVVRSSSSRMRARTFRERIKARLRTFASRFR